MRLLTLVFKPFLFIPLIFAAAILGGCATGVKQDGMIAFDYVASVKHTKTVSITVSDKSSTLSEDTVENISKSLIESIFLSKAFSQVTEDKPGDYELSVNIQKLKFPVMGFNMTVKMDANWVLKNTTSGVVVMQKMISSLHTARVREAFSGQERSILAVEGAVRNNIKQGLTEISQLKL